MKLKQTPQLLLFILLSQLAGIIGSMFTAPAIPNWYATLAKPALNPPSWVFGPVWTLLYILIGIAGFMIWSAYAGAPANKKRDIKIALSVFGVQLVLNALWSILFFGAQNPGLALTDITLLCLIIVWMMLLFYRIRKLAMYLLIPYILWVSFATYLNYSIWTLN